MCTDAARLQAQLQGVDEGEQQGAAPAQRHGLPLAEDDQRDRTPSRGPETTPKVKALNCAIDRIGAGEAHQRAAEDDAPGSASPRR